MPTKLPGAGKTTLVSLALSLFFFFLGRWKNLKMARVEGDGQQVIAPSCKGMDTGVLLAQRRAGRER